MGTRLKEEEKNEKAIRSLLRKTPNRRCMNCSSLGPQYVCLNFWTFVCTQCSGIHREFTHRVKSVSMSKFTSQEVANLENGGNERAREIYFKDWDSQRQPLPDSSNVDRLREFIKMVYVEKRFTGERPLPRARGGEKEDAYDSRPRANYRPDSRSPPYEDRYDERTPGGRRSNAGYDDRRWDERGSRFDEKRSPARFESERSRYDRGYNDDRGYDLRSRYEGRDRQQRYEDRYADGLDRQSEDRFANERGRRNYGGSSPPPIVPVKEILGEDVPPLRVESPGRQANGGGLQDGRGQRFGSSSSFGSLDGNAPVTAPIAAPVVKREEPTSLIDFSTEPDPPAAQQQPGDPLGLAPAVEPSGSISNSTGWATFDMFAAAPAALASSSGAFGPAPPSIPGQGVSGGFTSQSIPVNGNMNWASQWAAMSTSSTTNEPNANSWSSLVGPPIHPASSQSWNAFEENPNETSSSSSLPIPAVHDVPSVTSSVGVAPTVAPVKSAGRPEIPQDIFAGPPLATQFTGGPNFGPQYQSMSGMGMLAGNYNQTFQPQQPQKSLNPFDLPGDAPSAGSAVNEFPSLAPLQAALPTLNSVGVMSVPGPGLVPYGSQWSQPSTVARPENLYSSALAPPAANGLFSSQQAPTASPEIPQHSLGASVGGSMSALGVSMLGSFSNVPKQTTDSSFPSSSFSAVPPQNLFAEAADTLFTAQGAQFAYQNAAAPGVGGVTSAGQLFMSGQVMPGPLPQQQRLVSHSSLGSVSSMSGAESLFPSPPPAQRLTSHGSLGSLDNMMGLDSQFPMPQFPSQSSLGSTGNPFG